MRLLYHFWLDPFARKARIALGEKRLAFDLRLEKTWERRADFLVINPAGEVPVLAEPDGAMIIGHAALCEYLDEIVPEPPLLGTTPAQRAESRRLAAWFDEKFHREVTVNLVGEKMLKRFLGLGAPDSRAIRVGAANIHTHLDYISWLVERRSWLAGEHFSLADISAGAHLSAVDYVGDVPWDEHPHARDWYARLKSRPSFRPLLADMIPGAPPPKHYADLDF